MKPLDHLTEIRFTRDRDAARQSVSSFTGRRNDYTPRNTFEEQYLGKSPAAARAARAQIVMSGLRALATRMGEMDGGLGGIVLMSEGFTTDVPRGRERRLPDLQGLVRASSRFRVLLYAFDPGDAASSFPARLTAMPTSNRQPCFRGWRARPEAMVCQPVRTWAPLFNACRGTLIRTMS